MFDDTPVQSNAQVPPNLPIGEPEDIFDGTIPAEMGNAPGAPAVSGPPKIPSAVSSGILKPKVPGAAPRPDVGAPLGAAPVTSGAPEAHLDSSGEAAEPVFRTPPKEMNPSVHGDEVYRLKEPVLSRSLMTVAIVLLLLAALGGGGWWVYRTFFATKTTGTVVGREVPTTPVVTGETGGQTTLGESTTPAEPTETTAPDITTQISDDTILFGNIVDTDSDGLDDVREQDLGTDPKNWDTDGDELSDYNEVAIWKTDPFIKDTDGDGYADGVEVKNGYSPTGPGKLFEPPTSTVSSSASVGGTP